MFVNQPETGSTVQRDPEQIKAMIKMHEGAQNKQSHPDISYDEACREYKYYKSRTHKVDQGDPDFDQNVQLREFFLSIKKRFDMQERARRFRTKQKAEITLLRKRRNESDPSLVEQMEAKIESLQNMLVQRDQQIQDLKQESLKKQKIEDSQANLSTDLTKQGSSMKIDEIKTKKQMTESKNDEFKSFGPVSVNSNKRKLIVKIDTSIEPSVQYEESIEPFDTSKSSIEEAAPSYQNEMSFAAQSISERASNFVQKERVQKLLRKFVDQKLKYTNIQQNKVIQQQINEKEAEIRSDRQLLSNQMSQFLQQKITYAKLRQQPKQLLAKRDEFIQGIEDLYHKIAYIEENYQDTMNYIEEQGLMLQENEEQINMISDKINQNLSDIEALKKDKIDYPL